MRTLVSDTSVIVDLERGDLLEAIFDLPYEFAVPDLLYKHELKDYVGVDLISIGLVVEELGHESLRLAQNYYREHATKLSDSDSFALALAKNRAWILLTGDSFMRSLATEEGIECHGVLWLLDEFFRLEVATPKALFDGLTKISEHPRCRLPADEVDYRLIKYQKIDASN